MKKNVVVCGAWPYANSSLHLGHLVALLPGDFIARYHRKLGDNVIYVAGTDCHGTPITLRARKEGKQPNEIADYYDKEFNRTFEKMNFSYSLYSKTESDFHKKVCMDIFKRIYDNGYIIEKEELQPYCPNDQKFLADRELVLICPNCGRETKGEQCDCGYYPNEKDFKNARCQQCGTKVIEKENKNLFLKLSELQKDIEKYFNKYSCFWRFNSQRETKKFLDQGLIDRAVTRDLPWGIDVPINGYSNKKMYVWIEAVLGYITASMEYCQNNNLNFDDFWKNENSLIYMVHGKDNIIFHSIIFPSLMIAYDKNIKLPDKMVSCEYLNINDEKISKSKGNGITILDLANNYNVDSIRYYFLSNGPENKDSNFSIELFKNIHNTDLINKFGNFVNRTFNFKGITSIQKEFVDKEIEEKIINTYKKFDEYIEKLEIKNSISTIMELVEFGNKYYDEQKPWELFKSDKEKFNKVMFNCASIIINLANLFEPVMPETSKKISDFLNINIDKWGEIKIEKNILIDNFKPLFERIK